MNEKGYGKKFAWHNLRFCLQNLFRGSEENCKKLVFTLIFESKTFVYDAGMLYSTMTGDFVFLTG
jgi:hypothetical protein